MAGQTASPTYVVDGHDVADGSEYNVEANVAVEHPDVSAVQKVSFVDAWQARVPKWTEMRLEETVAPHPAA